MDSSEKRNISPGSLNSGSTSKDELAMVEAVPKDSDVGYDEKATRRLVRKIDLRLIPFLSLLYLLR